jgi:hypothetical protein
MSGIAVRRRAPALLAAVAGILLLVGLVAGVANRHVLDGPRFARHVDAMRSDPAVARLVGQAITRRALAVDPDLVTVRPFIEATAVTLVQSRLFGPVVRATAEQLHQAFTQPGSGQVVLRLADVGAVIHGTLRSLAPEAAARLPDNLDVTLAAAGEHSYAAETISWARAVGTLAWVLPTLALICLAVAMLISGDRKRTAMVCGISVASAGLTLGVLTLAAALWVSTVDVRTLRGALIVAAWKQLDGSLWATATLALLAGALVIVAARVWQSRDGALTAARGAWTWLVAPRTHPKARLARTVLFLVVGVLLTVRPTVVVPVLAVLCGLALLAVGLSELAGLVVTASSRLRLTAPAWLRSSRTWAGVGCTVGALMLVTLVVVDSQPARDLALASPQVVEGSGRCNGSAALCSRPYNEVAFPGTHNSMAAADESGWSLPEQPTGIIGQLKDGIRVFLIDTWYGQATQRPGVIANRLVDRTRILEEEKLTLRPDVVASVFRLKGYAKLTPEGPARPYLCHTFCELGSTPFEPVMVRVHRWMVAHPRDVVTFIIQDQVSPADTARVIQRAGLLPFVHTQSRTKPWPTLGRMVSSGRRLVVFMERHGGGPAHPWLLPAARWVQDTPFNFASADKFTCNRLRGPANAPLFLVNHWLNRFHARIRDSKQINAYKVLWPRLKMCESERSMIPNFVAVNFYNHGDLVKAVAKLNGLS